MRAFVLSAFLLGLPVLATGSPLTTVLYREVVQPSAIQLDGIYAGLRACDAAGLLPRDLFAALGLPYDAKGPRLTDGQTYRLTHPVSLGQRLLLTEVTRQQAGNAIALRLRFNKSLSLFAAELPPALGSLVAAASASAAESFALSDEGRELTCQREPRAPVQR